MRNFKVPSEFETHKRFYHNIFFGDLLLKDTPNIILTLTESSPLRRLQLLLNLSEVGKVAPAVFWVVFDKFKHILPEKKSSEDHVFLKLLQMLQFLT